MSTPKVPKKFSFQRLPDEPGVYRYYNSKGILIYVGKAKSIKKRVSSYFNKQTGLNLKTRKLVSEIAEIQYTLTNDEFDALLLENNFIKENQPKYNILLKDDKSFPYVAILKERFPRIISTRRYEPEKAEYFGPYTSVVAMKSVLDLIRKLYKIRTCNYNLSEKNINQGKFKVCLEYHIGNCLGPCEGHQSEEDYMKDIKSARQILKGDMALVSRNFRENMASASEQLSFELAQTYKDKIDLLEKFNAKATVVNPRISNTDVITMVSDESKAWFNFLQIRNGAIILSRNMEVKKKLDEEDPEILQKIIVHLRSQTGSKNKSILANRKFELPLEEIEVRVPRIGDKKKLVELSLKNALEYKKDKIIREEPQKKRILLQLQQDLHLKEYPDHIECFDNSNLSGSDPVASMVCFKEGKPSKSDYRKFSIKTVVGPDDFASMKEIVTRRYRKLKEEDLPFPKLVVIDGGKGQLSSAKEALEELGLYGQIPIIGIAKRLEEIYFPGDSFPIHISKRSPSLKLIQQLRDEAHRFAINYHRQKRSKSTFKTELESIEGIGKATADKLLKKHKSIRKISNLDLATLQDTVGKSAAKKVYDHFQSGS